jgi:hypothetical protein
MSVASFGIVAPALPSRGKIRQQRLEMGSRNLSRIPRGRASLNLQFTNAFSAGPSAALHAGGCSVTGSFATGLQRAPFVGKPAHAFPQPEPRDVEIRARLLQVAVYDIQARHAPRRNGRADEAGRRRLPDADIVDLIAYVSSRQPLSAREST